MIKGVVIINNYGKARLVKFYEDVDFSIQKQTIREIFTQVSKRKANVCNFLSTGSVKAWPDTLLVCVDSFPTVRPLSRVSVRGWWFACCHVA